MSEFDLELFWPFRLHQTAESVSQNFRPIYKNAEGLSRTEWRVLAHLGQYGALTASEIGRRAGLHKTKVSRAVHSLETRRWLTRTTDPHDRRIQTLDLTRAGSRTYARLGQLAAEHNAALVAQLGQQDFERLLSLLGKLSQQPGA